MSQELRTHLAGMVIGGLLALVSAALYMELRGIRFTRADDQHYQHHEGDNPNRNSIDSSGS